MSNPEYICDVCSAPSDDVVTCAICGNSFCGECGDVISRTCENCDEEHDHE